MLCPKGEFLDEMKYRIPPKQSHNIEKSRSPLNTSHDNSDDIPHNGTGYFIINQNTMSDNTSVPAVHSVDSDSLTVCPILQECLHFSACSFVFVNEMCLPGTQLRGRSRLEFKFTCIPSLTLTKNAFSIISIRSDENKISVNTVPAKEAFNIKCLPLAEAYDYG